MPFYNRATWSLLPRTSKLCETYLYGFDQSIWHNYQRQYFPVFSTVQLFSPFNTVFFVGKSQSISIIKEQLSQYLHSLLEIPLYWRVISSPLFIFYSIIYLYQNGLYFVLRDIDQEYIIYFVTQIDPALAIENFQLESVSFLHNLIILCFERYLSCWHYELLQFFLYILCPGSKTSYLSKSCDLFYWRMVLETEI